MSPPLWRVPPLAAEIISLIDGQRTTGTILDLLDAATGVAVEDRGAGRRAAIKEQMVLIMRGLISMNKLALGYDQWPHAIEEEQYANYPAALARPNGCFFAVWQLL